MDESQVQDICRVCRSEATPDKPLYHPCICTGSIKFIHQECLLQWLKYSRKEYCELCSHRFSFMPIYSPDMPKRLPIKDIISGLLCSLGTAVRFWLHYTLVAVAWLGIVPLTACRIYRCLFTGSLSSIITLPFDILSTENILSDSLYGCFVVTCTLCAFISLVWLREQIIHGGGPEWLEHEHDVIQPAAPVAPPNPAPPPPPADLVNMENPSASIHDHTPSSSNTETQDFSMSGLHSSELEDSPLNSYNSHSSDEFIQKSSPPANSFHHRHSTPPLNINSSSSSSFSQNRRSPSPPSNSRQQSPFSAGEFPPLNINSSSSSSFSQNRRSPSPPSNSRQQSPFSSGEFVDLRQSSASPPANLVHPQRLSLSSENPPLNIHSPGSSSFSQNRRSPSPPSNSHQHSPFSSGEFVDLRQSSASPPANLVHPQRLSLSSDNPPLNIHSPGSSNFNQNRRSPSPPSSSRQHSPFGSGDFVDLRLSSASPPANLVHPQHLSLSSEDFVHRRSSPSPPPLHHHSSVRHSSSSPPPGFSQQRRSSLPADSQLQNAAAAMNAVQISASASISTVPHQSTPPLAGDTDDDQNHAVLDNEDDVEVNEGNNGAEDVNNWNPIEWDHAAEELTWERLLGLDGSLVFLEHVFWVVSLNTLFIVVFAFFPYHIGQISLSCFGFKEYVRAPEFEGLLTTLFGYINIGIVLALLHGVAALVQLDRTQRLLGICYVVIKVSLLSVIEIGIFPLICGWWLDICSLTLLDATLQDREAGFKLAPGTSMFIHWLAGMVYVFYFASFILLLREVLRPGVLWFLKNLNDPDFNPIQEMIHSPILRHVRRVLISLVTFGTTILLVVWLPVRIIEKVAPSFLPFQVMLANDMPYSELSLELVLLQVVLPALLEQGHMRNWLKFSVRSWCIAVSYILDIRSYLLGDVNLDEQGDTVNAPAPAPEPGNAQEGLQGGALAAAHQALFQPVSPMFLPYKRPKFLPFKIVCLIFFICISLTMGSLIMFTVPVYIGRKVMSLWLGNTKIHELYTLGCGMYVCWLALRVSTLLWSWIPKGWASISQKLKELLLIVSIGAKLLMMVKLLCAMSMLLIVIPVLMGLTLDMIVTVPARVALNQTPLISLWQDWAIGVLLTKTFFAVVLVGPDWWMKRIIEQVYLGGIRNINLKLIFVDLSLPILITLGLSLSVPYIIACSFIPMFTSNFELQNTVLRRIYPALLAIGLLLQAIVFHVRQFRRMYEHIRNDKYLVGKRLVNYEHRKLQEASQAKEETSSAS